MSEEKQAAISTQNTLRKLGSHLRWLLEKSGIDAERCHVIIGVPDAIAQNRVRGVMIKEFDRGSMEQNTCAPSTTWVHGVPISIYVSEPSA